MTSRKWYTPSGAILRIISRIAHRIKKPLPMMIACALYGMIDIFGSSNVPAMLVWMQQKIQENELGFERIRALIEKKQEKKNGTREEKNRLSGL